MATTASVGQYEQQRQGDRRSRDGHEGQQWQQRKEEEQHQRQRIWLQHLRADLTDADSDLCRVLYDGEREVGEGGRREREGERKSY